MNDNRLTNQYAKHQSKAQDLKRKYEETDNQKYLRKSEFHENKAKAYNTLLSAPRNYITNNETNKYNNSRTNIASGNSAEFNGAKANINTKVKFAKYKRK